MRFAFFLFAIIAFAAGLRPLMNDYARKAEDPSEVQISEIDEVTAKKLFKDFRADRKIAFGYPIDGCYSRADIMARTAEKRHIFMGKVVVEGDLQAKTDSALYPVIAWGWHIAPVAYVKGVDGKTKLLVFDPGLFKEPVTVDEWQSAMAYDTPDYKTNLKALYFGSRFQYDMRKNQGTLTQWFASIVKYDEEKMAEYSKYQGKAPMAAVKGMGLIAPPPRSMGEMPFPTSAATPWSTTPSAPSEGTK